MTPANGGSAGEQWSPHPLSAKSIGTTTVAEHFDRCCERCADQVTAFTRVHLKLFLAIDNRSRLKQHSRHSCCSQHDKQVLSGDAHIRVGQFVPISDLDALR